MGGFAALHDALKRSNFAQHAKNTTELAEALEKGGFTQRRTNAGRFWRFPAQATSMATARAAADHFVEARRVMTADEVEAWEAAGKPGLVKGRKGRRQTPAGISPETTVTPVTGEIA